MNIFDSIPENGIGETELSVACGLSLANLRSEIAKLVKRRAIESVPGLPDHWRPVITRIPQPEQVKALLKDGRLDAISIAIELDCGAAQTSAILTKMEKAGEIINPKGDYWELADGNGVFSNGSVDPSAEVEVITNEQGRNSGGRNLFAVTPSDRSNHNGSSESGLERLTYDEMQRRQHLERKIERGFYEAGKALAEIREKRLYRDRWQNWGDYIADRFGWKRDYANKQIAAAQVVDGLIQSYETNTNSILSGTTTGTLPTAETQVRPLVPLSQEHRATVWKEAVDKSNGKVPTESTVKAVVEDFLNREKYSAPNPYRVGQVVSMKGKKGWFIVYGVGEFCCNCQDFTGKQYDFRHFELRELDLPPEQRTFAVHLQEKLSNLWRMGDRLTSDKDSATVKALVQAVGLNAMGFLTEFQENLLQLAENLEEF